MLKIKTLILIIVVLYFTASLVYMFSAIDAYSQGAIAMTIADATLSIVWFVFFCLWSHVYLTNRN